MIVVMQPGAAETSISAVVDRIKDLGLDAHLSSGEQRTIIGVVGTTPLPPTLDEMLEAYEDVEQVLRVTKKYKLSGWDFHPQKTVIKVLDFEIGGDEVIVIAGPCSVESEEQTLATARAVKAAGAKILRGGAYKPRTSPYEFRGLGQKGLEILATAREETGLAIITEVMTPGRCRAGLRVHRHLPDRRAQLPELLPAGRSRQDRQAGHAQARHEHADRRVAAGGRVRARPEQSERDLLRARDPHLREPDAQYARYRGGAGGAEALAPADLRRPEPRRRQASVRGAAGAGGSCGRARMG